jgi:hypothetical protein
MLPNGNRKRSRQDDHFRGTAPVGNRAYYASAAVQIICHDDMGFFDKDLLA